MVSLSINFSDSAQVCEALQKATVTLLGFSGRKGCTHHLPTKGNLLVSGDLHDNPIHLAKITKLANLDIPTNHVLFQELIHVSGDTGSMDLSYRMLVRVAILVCLYPGQVHPILANHELSQATNRAITKGGAELVNKFTQGVTYVFGNNSASVTDALHEFILAMPLAVRTSTGLMCLHSLPSAVNMDTFDTGILARELLSKDLHGEQGSAYMVVWGRNHTKAQIDTLAQYWGIKLFCLGHAWVPEGVNVAFENVIQLNSDHNNGTVISIPLNAISTAQKTAAKAVKLNTISIEVHEL